jgi:hypothetical protein
MLTAFNFPLKQLLWAAKTADDGDNKLLLAQVFTSIVKITKSGGNLAGVDLIVAIRSVLDIPVSLLYPDPFARTAA